MKLFIAISIFLSSAICMGQVAEFSFLDKTTVKFDKTPEGELLKHYFVFTNTGDIPLTINDAKVTCSCTNVEFPTSPIPPNATDSIKVTFDTNGKFYYQDRVIELIANTKKNQKLKLKVYVIPKEED